MTCPCTHEDPRMCAAGCDCADGGEPMHVFECRAACDCDCHIAVASHGL